MIITREGIIKYWLSEPMRNPEVFIMGQIWFPDVETLSSGEKDALRPVLAAHPEYLLGISASKIVQ